MSSVIVCHACDLVHRRDAILPNVRVRCLRCHAELYRTSGASLDGAIAVAVSALALLILSNAYPLVQFTVNGTARSTTLAGAALAMFDQGYAPLALLVVATTILVPLIQITALLYVLLPLRADRRASRQNEAIRAWTALRPWAMSEVFLLGSLVAIVKLSALAVVVPGISLFAYGALMLALSGLTSMIPTEQVWRWADGARP